MSRLRCTPFRHRWTSRPSCFRSSTPSWIHWSSIRCCCRCWTLSCCRCSTRSTTRWSRRRRRLPQTRWSRRRRLARCSPRMTRPTRRPRGLRLHRCRPRRLPPRSSNRWMRSCSVPQKRTRTSRSSSPSSMRRPQTRRRCLRSILRIQPPRRQQQDRQAQRKLSKRSFVDLSPGGADQRATRTSYRFDVSALGLRELPRNGRVYATLSPRRIFALDRRTSVRKPHTRRERQGFPPGPFPSTRYALGALRALSLLRACGSLATAAVDSAGVAATVPVGPVAVAERAKASHDVRMRDPPAAPPDGAPGVNDPRTEGVRTPPPR